MENDVVHGGENSVAIDCLKLNYIYMDVCKTKFGELFKEKSTLIVDNGF